MGDLVLVDGDKLCFILATIERWDEKVVPQMREYKLGPVQADMNDAAVKLVAQIRAEVVGTLCPKLPLDKPCTCGAPDGIACGHWAHMDARGLYYANHTYR